MEIVLREIGKNNPVKSPLGKPPIPQKKYPEENVPKRKNLPEIKALILNFFRLVFELLFVVLFFGVGGG